MDLDGFCMIATLYAMQNYLVHLWQPLRGYIYELADTSIAVTLFHPAGTAKSLVLHQYIVFPESIYKFKTYEPPFKIRSVPYDALPFGRPVIFPSITL